MTDKATKAYRKAYYKKHKKNINKVSVAWRKKNKERVKLSTVKWRRDNPAAFLWQNAKDRAKRKHVKFTISKEDIVVPSVCPVLGIPILFTSGKGMTDNSPSIDRLLPEAGYIKGNIAVISNRANRFKSNASAAEIRLLASWMERKIEFQGTD